MLTKSRNFILTHGTSFLRHGNLFLQRHGTQKHTGVSLNVKPVNNVI